MLSLQKNIMTDRATAIIVGAGYSRRFGEDKIFKPLMGKALIEWTLRPFLENNLIKEVILVLRPEVLSQARALFPESKVRAIVPGGQSRSQSVQNGLNEVQDARLVLVHDGDRPCLSQQLLNRILGELEYYPAVVPLLPGKETVKAVKSEMFVERTLGKEFWVAQTPQGFQTRVLREAFSSLEDVNSSPDEAFLMERAGVPVKGVMGEDTNIKVTVPLDFKIAEMILREQTGAKSGFGY